MTITQKECLENLIKYIHWNDIDVVEIKDSIETLADLVLEQVAKIEKLELELKYYKKLYFETNDWLKDSGDHIPKID